jgi:succinate dehydrogenase/fumarate reductase flavoprotein subunit
MGEQLISEQGQTGSGPSSTWDETFDLVVLGAGVGGLTSALVGSLEGLSTLLVEKTDRVGGTSARSSGTVWIPDNPYQRGLGVSGDGDAAREYLDALVGDRADRRLREAFLSAGPAMLRYLQERADIHFRPYLSAPDYRQDLAGAALGGRPLEPLPFDGRTLGERFDRVGWPLRELMLFGGMMVTRGEAARLLRIGQSFDALVLGFTLVSRYALDRVRYRRGTRLVLGNALVARLYKALLDRGVPVWLNGTTPQLVREGLRIAGLIVETEGRRRRVRARCGVILAGGGFPASPAWRERYLPRPVAQYTSAYEGCVGETLSLAQAAGAALGAPGLDNALWFPSSIAIRADGTTAVYPHIVLDRAKPGLVTVNASGRRFVDEAVSYHEFTRAMYRSHARVPSIPAWLICDRRFLWKYGLGLVRPLTLRVKPFIARGYLHAANTLDALAARIGVEPAGLRETVRMNNVSARTGEDIEFKKGGNPFDRNNGDPEHAPNPCLGPIEVPPFYAVAVLPTPLGTSLGVLTNASGQALDERGSPIEGLYACGNDMNSPFGGEYPGAGAQLGLAMTFGYVAAQHAAQQERAAVLVSARR